MTQNRQLTTQEKARLYDDYVRIVDNLNRQNSKLRAEYVVNIPDHVENVIKENNKKIAYYVNETEKLTRGA